MAFNLPAFSPGAASEPTSKVELTLSAEGLRDMDIVSKSDPMCVVYLKEFNGRAQYIEVGRTETINNTLNPKWVKKILLDYKFEERQMLKFDIYDWDDSTSNLQNQDFLGSYECTLADIVTGGSAGAAFIRNIKPKGKLRVTVEELQSCKEEFVFKFSAKSVDKKDFFGKSDPFMVISRSLADGRNFAICHKTEFVKNTLDPSWKPFRLSGTSLCNGDYQRTLKFQVFDWNSSGNEDFIGEATTNLKQLLDSPKPFSMELINAPKREKKGSKYKNSGILVLEKISTESQYSFLDFIQGGTQINFTVAVDFTASNGNPDSPNSLHYRNPTGGPNQYVTAINSVGEIIQDYDSDKMFPALGFGARIPPNGAVSHEFFLNLRSDTPYCQGVEGILQAYYTSLHNVQLYGPTNFTPVIKHVANFARACVNDPTNYFVLLIITDGIITDMENTKYAIVEASSLPMSIIIVGVGSEDFSAMDELDSDDGLLKAGDYKAQRDIVQFVELRKFLRDGGSWCKEYLAKEVLAEIPDQLIGYMKKKGFKPNTPTAPTLS